MRRNKYNVSPAEQRRWRGKTYDSKAEMQYAQQLDLRLRANDILGYAEQPQVHLAGEWRYKPDFVVFEKHESYYVDVKGVETQSFKNVCKAWTSPVKLMVVKRKGNGFEVYAEYQAE